MSLLFNMLSRFVIAFLPRSKRLVISWLQSPSAVILEPKKIKSVTISIVSPSICHEVMGLDAMILVFWRSSECVCVCVYVSGAEGSIFQEVVRKTNANVARWMIAYSKWSRHPKWLWQGPGIMDVPPQRGTGPLALMFSKFLWPLLSLLSPERFFSSPTWKLAWSFLGKLNPRR